ncbi:MAG: aminomethyltransferase family protein [Pseudomonadota bacterium]
MSGSDSTFDYAYSHPVIRISSKRFDRSPFMPRWYTPETICGIYARRLYPLSTGLDTGTGYWTLRERVALFDVPERPIEIAGPDAVALLEDVFTRPVSDLKLLRARYAIACNAAGGMIMDGVLIRLDADRFWYVEANGEFETWLDAVGLGRRVSVSDPRAHVLQVQGPRSFDVLRALAEGSLPEPFGFFHAMWLSFAGQRVLVTRSGWTGESGFEIYVTPEVDSLGLWDWLLDVGQPYGLAFAAADVMGIRRLEAGILDYGTDLDASLTPFAAGLGQFVDFDKPEFIGRSALLAASREVRLTGLRTTDPIPAAGAEVWKEGARAGRMTAATWSPSLRCSIGYVIFDDARHATSGTQVEVVGPDLERHPGVVASLPFLDPEKRLLRGLPL